jgi:hypothetical protein
MGKPSVVFVDTEKQDAIIYFPDSSRPLSAACAA